ncbi:hypothetical protein [Roseibacillus ishigakijimensis]|uniref:Uncharacterized protein n=1 Tax=Roseibacillus ishigakijimensis TaxID=454146 RepID=A0A934VNH2_9BACT|nr:hypothetical protein [Roseibacillus ishigakijimensis]MBK1835040.1 hypothetical protein [Roseibacillus ishigakijimensis]
MNESSKDALIKRQAATIEGCLSLIEKYSRYCDELQERLASYRKAYFEKEGQR